MHKGSPSTDSPLCEFLELQERELPPISMGSALVRIDGAPVNPSDTMFIRGQYGVKPRKGDIPGFEGCGTVLAANAGPYGWWLKGRRVSFGGQDGNGSWTQYAVVPVFACIPVSKSLPVDVAATLIVNPMTAIGLLERARKHGTKAVVLNAAGSALARHVVAIARRSGIQVIALVRRRESADELRALGGCEVLVTTDKGHLEQFRKLCLQHDARVLLDAVAGDETALLLNAMPDRSLAIVYGQLSQESLDVRQAVPRVSIDSDGLVFRKQQTEGYWLTHELHGFKGVFTPLWRARRIASFYQQSILEMGPVTATSLEDLVPTVDQGAQGTKIIYRASSPSLHHHGDASENRVGQGDSSKETITS